MRACVLACERTCVFDANVQFCFIFEHTRTHTHAHNKRHREKPSMCHCESRSDLFGPCGPHSGEMWRSAWNVRTSHWPYCLVRSLALRPCRATRQYRLDDDTDNDNNIGSNDVICPSYNSPYYNSTRCGVVAGTHTHTHCITSISLRSHNTPNNRHVVHTNTTSIEEENPIPNFTLIQ